MSKLFNVMGQLTAGVSPHNNSYTYRGRLEDEIKESILKLVKNSGNIADLGCSLGATTIDLARRYSNSFVYGIDMDEEVLSKHNRIFLPCGTGFNFRGFPEVYGIERPDKSNYNLVQAQIPELLFNEEFFTTMFDMNNSYYSVYNSLMRMRQEEDTDAFRRYFSRINSYLEDGGLYIISGDFCVSELRHRDIETMVFRKRKDRMSLELFENESLGDKSSVAEYISDCIMLN